MDSVRARGVRCAIFALTGLWFGSAFATEEITERASINLSPMRQAPAIPGAMGGASGTSGSASGGVAGGASAAGGAGAASGGTAGSGGPSAAGGTGNLAGGAAAGAAAGAASGSGSAGGIRSAPGAAAGGAPGGAALGGAAGTQRSIEQQLAIMQQRIRNLETQVAALQSVLIITHAGATLQAPTLMLHSLSGTTIRSGKGIVVDASESITTRSGTSTLIRAGSTALVEGTGTLDVKGSPIRLNGGSKPLAAVGSQIQISGQPIGQVISGSSTILGN